jgi:PAS domain S-box-containing protein
MRRRGSEPAANAGKKPAGRGPARRRWVLDSVAVAVVLVTIGPLELYVAALGGTESPSFVDWLLLPWVPMGIAVGVLLLRGLDRWPGVVAGSLGYYLYNQVAPSLVAVGVVADTLAVLVICVLLRAWRFNPAIERWRDPLLLWSAAAIGTLGQMCITAAGFLALAWFDPTHLSPAYSHVMLDASGHGTVSLAVLQVAMRWWLNWTAGVALVVPCFYPLTRAGRQHFKLSLPELPILLLILSGWILAMFAPLPSAARLPLALIGLLLVTWSAIRFGAGLTSFMTLTMALTTSVSYMLGRGPLHARPADGLADAWALIIMIAAIGQLIFALLAERDAAARRQSASEMRYRTLFDANPQPLWVLDPASQRILMANEAAMLHYGYTREEFTTLRACDLEAQERPDAAPDGAGVVISEDREQAHRTRDGRLIFVELRTQPIEFDGREASLVFCLDVTDRNRLRSALIGATDRANRQLGQELHDGLGQELVGLSLITRSQITKLGRGVAPDAEAIGVIDRIARRAILACRNIAHGLSALAETGGDLPASLEKLPERFAGDGAPAIHVDIRNEAELVLPDAVRDHVYRIAQEALTNAVKHAHASRVDIRFAVTPTTVTLSVLDDGVGLAPRATWAQGLGLSSMRHRAAAIGARLDVTSADGGGTEVRVEFPHGPAASNTDANAESSARWQPRQVG